MVCLLSYVRREMSSRRISWPAIRSQRGIGLEMVPQHQLDRVRVKIYLSFQVRLPVFPHIMVYEGYRHDEGDVSLMIGLNDLEKFRLFITRKLFFEIAHPMEEHVGVLSRGGLRRRASMRRLR